MHEGGEMCSEKRKNAHIYFVLSNLPRFIVDPIISGEEWLVVAGDVGV